MRGGRLGHRNYQFVKKRKKKEMRKTLSARETEERVRLPKTTPIYSENGRREGVPSEWPCWGGRKGANMEGGGAPAVSVGREGRKRTKKKGGNPYLI